MSLLAQETSGSATGSSLTLTLSQATTVNNAMVITVAGFSGSTISGITLGGTGSLFTEIASSGSSTQNAQVWLCPSIPSATTSIVITAGASGIIAYAYEISGYLSTGGNIAVLDQSAANFSTGSSWSSGATGSTLGAAEFVVGIGSATGSSSVTATGPASGWTNEAAINGVHVSSTFYSAVSGYQAQNYTSAAYTYSGSLSGSANWGAVTATFVVAAQQTGWGGVIFNEHPSYTQIGATFTIPSLTGESGSLCSVWVGLGNVYQTGIYLAYSTSSAGNASTRPWSWWLAGAGELWNQNDYPTAAGNSLTLNIQLTTADWLMTITNHTQGWTYTEVKSVLAVNVGSIQNNGAGPAAWPYPVGQAEIIIEKEGSSTNPDYGSIAFTSITTTPAIASTPVPVITLNTGIDQYPGAFSTSSGSFTMYWNGYS